MVKSKALILCEGGNDIGFLKKFCDYLELDKKKIDIQKVSGKSNFFKENSYVTIKQKIDKGLYSKVLFIVDADSTYGGFKNSTNELVNIIRTLDIEEKSKIFIACDRQEKPTNIYKIV